MGWLLDLIVLLIIGVTIFAAYKRGFVKTLISTCSFLIAIILTSVLAAPLTDVLKDAAVTELVEDASEQKIITILDENALEPKDLFEGRSEEFNRLVSISGIDKDDFLEEQEEKREALIAQTAKIVSAPIIHTFASTLAIIIIYFSVRVALCVAGYFLDRLAKLPLLRTVNKTFGLLLGVLLALFRVLLFCFIVKILIEVGAFIGNDFLVSLNSGDAVIFDWFANNNFFFLIQRH